MMGLSKYETLQKYVLTLQRRYDLLVRDKRLEEYHALLRIMRDGELIESELNKINTLLKSREVELQQLYEQDKAVQSRVEESKQPIQKNYKRTDEQLETAHRSDIATETRNYPKQPTQPKEREAPTRVFETDKDELGMDDLDIEGLPDLDDQDE